MAFIERDRLKSLKILKLKCRRLSSMGLVKLRIREFAGEHGWTLKEVSERSGVPYGTIKTYALSDGMAMADVTALFKLARTFNVLVEDLVEIVKE